MTVADLMRQPERLLGPVKVRLPILDKLPRAVVKITDKGPAVLNVEATSLLQTRVAEAFRAGRLGGLRKRDLREVSKVYLHPPSPPGHDDELGPAIVREICSRRRKAAFHTLVETYLDAFSTSDIHVIRFGALLEQASRAWDWSPRNSAWPDRIARYRLFEADVAPEAIAEAVLGRHRSVPEALADAGLDVESRKRGGLGLAAFRSACARVQSATPPALPVLQERLIDWGCTERSGKKLNLAPAWPEFANALLIPWGPKVTEASLAPDHRKLVAELVVDYAGDPRINSPRWKQVDPGALAVIKKWLVRASVLQFFDIVDAIAEDRMWRYRRAFWKSFIDETLVDDAWVVFGAAGASRAVAAADRSGEASLKQFGRLESGGGRSPTQSCLVMTMGDVTVAEWSHNGRCNIWRADDEGHPKLGKHRYWPEELSHRSFLVDRGQRIGIAHMSSDTYAWQRRVAEQIRIYTGRRTKPASWVP